jgi:alkanesulfonate monooxygenase SsuD/methylene tetrahydromethanopterin reductase-like flavin-dependent oxidoreductase (luciferase family)
VTLANGGRSQTFDGFGITMRSRARRLEELTRVLRGLLAGESVTFHGRYLTLEGVRISPQPCVPVELWLAGTVPAAAARAGTLGDAWLTGQNTPDEELVRQLDVYREAAAQAGRPARAVLRRDIFVAETEATAHAEVDRVLAEGYRGTSKAELVVGSPETVVERLRHYRTLGFEKVMVRHITGDHQQMLRSFALIGQHIMPAIRAL